MIPKRMQHLDRDSRGYPIPVTVYRDREGRPHFTINDQATHAQLLFYDRCGICGQRLLPVRWFVGGPLSAFDPNGAYLDLPMHRQCLHYALRVCPYLAMPAYNKRIDAGTIREPEAQRLFMDPTMIPDRPEVFVVVGARSQTVRTRDDPAAPWCIIPDRPYVTVEYWQHGKRLSVREGRQLVHVDF
jgi:hypothetical protein